MSGSGVRMMAGAWLAAMLLLPADSGSAEKKKSKAEIASEQALAAERARFDAAFDAWQDTAQWRTVPQEELAMTSEPLAPGAAAVFLYTESERNNQHKGEMTYRQIKVLTDEGRNLANITLSYNQKTEKIRRIDARVIQPDGAIVPFSGEIYDRPLEAGGQLSMHARSFTLPDVRVGSIIEVRYWKTFPVGSDARTITVPTESGNLIVQVGAGALVFPPSRWILNQPLFTRHARYSLQMLNGQFVRWTLPKVLPAGASEPRIEANHVVRMETRNMPQFVTEEYMPPPDDLVPSVDFSYDRSESASNPAKFWKTYGENSSKEIEEFLGNPKYVSRRLDKIIARGDSAEQKLRKIYDRVRRMGNTDIPGSMDEKTWQKCNRYHEFVWDVAEENCGNSAELALYFTALCRAAGLTASPVRVSSRQQRFFSPETADSSRFSNWLVAVTIDGREIVLSPGVPFLPFGSLAWWDTAVPAFKPGKDGGSWFTTRVPVPADAATHRKASLSLSEDGVLEGSVVVRHSGHQAVTRVVAMLLADEHTRLEMLKEDLRSMLAAPADISVVRQPDWQTGDGVLEVEYRVKLQEWAVSSGSRMLVGVGLFGKDLTGKFVAPKREHPIYFAFPYTAEDEIEITLPSGFRLQNSPAKQVSPDAALKYVTSVESREGVISIRRAITHDLLLARQNQYPRVKGFYELARSGDQEQVVLTR